MRPTPRAQPPVGFGYKSAWLAIRSSELEAVTRAFGFQRVERVDLGTAMHDVPGTPRESAGALLLTPPVDGWVLALDLFSGLLADERSRGETLRRLSRALGEVQVFVNDRRVDVYAWGRARNGRIVRRYEMDLANDTARSQGRATKVELDRLGENDGDPHAWSPTEQDVIAVASAWSVNPLQLPRLPIARGKARLGRVAPREAAGAIAAPAKPSKADDPFTLPCWENERPLPPAVIAREKEYGPGLLGHERRELAVTVCFLPGHFSAEDLAGFRRRHFPELDEPRVVAVRAKAETWVRDHVLGPRLSRTDFQTKGGPGLVQVRWTVREGARAPGEALAWLMERAGFSAAYLHPYWDESYQSAPHHSHISTRPKAHLARPSNYKAPRRNPVRSVIFPGFRLQVAWRMWFGPFALEHLDRDAILAFEGARRVDEMPGGIVHVELHEDPFDAASGPNRELQRRFRESSGMIALERRGAEVAAALPTPR